MKKVSVILADGFEEVEALTVVDLLRRATIYVDTVSITEDYTVHGAHGINVQTEDLFEEVNFVESDMIVLPGGMPGTKNLDAHAGVRRVVKGFYDEGKKIAAICAAPTVLGNMGLLKGKRVSCYPSMEKEIQGAVISGGSVTVDGNIITTSQHRDEDQRPDAAGDCGDRLRFCQEIGCHRFCCRYQSRRNRGRYFYLGTGSAYRRKPGCGCDQRWR